MKSPQLEWFMTRLPTQVKLEEAPDGKTTLRGLPILRVGHWNGRQYTAEDLQAMAANFDEIAASENWQPPVRPYHQRDVDGNPVLMDARQLLAWHSALHYDSTKQVLEADLEIVDAATVADLQSGKLRHVSAEVYRSGYQAPSSGKQYETPVLVGAAFVDDPAVKGMPWELVVNAQEVRQMPDAPRVECLSWQGLSSDEVRTKLCEALAPNGGDSAVVGELWVNELYEEYAIVQDGSDTYRVAYTVGPDQAVTVGERTPVRQQWVAVEQSAAALNTDGRTPAAMKDGDRPMSWLETLKNVLRKEGAADEDLAAVDQLAAAVPPAHGDTPPEPPAPNDGLRAQVDQMAQTVRDQAALIEQLRQTRAQESAQAAVDTLVREGIVPPALRVQCLALVSALGAAPAVEVLAEGGTKSMPALELLTELLRGMAPRLSGPRPAVLRDAPEQLAEGVAPLTDEQLDKIAALAGGTPKGGAS